MEIVLHFYPKSIHIWFGLMLNVPVNNFSVMLGWGHHFLGIASTLVGGGGGGGGEGEYVLLKDTTW